MKRVHVWQVIPEAIKFLRHYEDGQLILRPIRDRMKWLGSCEATPQAVAQLTRVEEQLAAEALSKPWEPIFVTRTVYIAWLSPPIVLSYHIMVTPSYQKLARSENACD